jgi:hypothetical protein
MTPTNTLNNNTSNNNTPPADGKINEQDAWYVRSILRKRKIKGKKYISYLTEWENGQRTWETARSLNNPDLIQEFNSREDHVEDEDSDVKTDDNDNKTSNNEEYNTDDPEEVPKGYLTLIKAKFFCYLTKLRSNKTHTWKDFIIPKTFQDVLNSEQKEQWLEAIRKEMEQLQRLKTWRRCKRKPRKKPITCRWVFKIKPPTSLNAEPIFKARLCAHGFKQKEQDYGATFAQVATMKAFRILLWIATYLNLRPTQLDVKNAFLNAKIDTEIYMHPPPGFENIGFVRLQKTIYGLKQSPRLWRQTLVSKLTQLNFSPLVSDSCIFKHKNEIFFILIFVDDIICITNNEKLRKTIETELDNAFDIKILGELTHFVGIEVTIHKDKSISICQEKYLIKILERFTETNKYYNINKTPADSNITFKRTQQPTNEKEKINKPYRQLIGSLLYLLATRPEIYFIVVALSAFVTNPGIIHWTAATYILYYLKGTSDLKIHFKRKQTLKIKAYCDSDWAQCEINRKSTSGYIIYLGSTPIIWRSKKQVGKPAISSCEAEYRALTEVVNDIVWLISFLTELGFNVPRPIEVYCDNKSARDLAENPVNHDRTKHIDIRFHRIREYILDGTIIIHHIPTENNPADLFTKAVTKKIFNRLISILYDHDNMNVLYSE